MLVRYEREMGAKARDLFQAGPGATLRSGRWMPCRRVRCRPCSAGEVLITDREAWSEQEATQRAGRDRLSEINSELVDELR